MNRHLAIAASLVLCAVLAAPATASAWESRTSRSFRTADSPGRARSIVNNMTVRDGSRFGALPPGVSARRTGPGSFKARSPLASVKAQISVRPARGGGSIVTEQTRARSICPGAAMMANTIHGAATSLRDAYSNASRRTGR